MRWHSMVPHLLHKSPIGKRLTKMSVQQNLPNISASILSSDGIPLHRLRAALLEDGERYALLQK